MLWRDEAVELKANILNQLEYSTRINILKNIQVLYIDDLFKQGNMQYTKPSSADINLVFEIINYRYNMPNLVTILSSEYMIEDIAKFDEAIAGRIYERCGNYCMGLIDDGTKNYRLHD